ncbi:hypothetical protein [Paenarthrobacter sp. A20]|uniref:hypothetical protein n=1 Tax=Paenarthrobacter sp. A20 TaxID=2817891 RepID=UPI0020A12F6A|nr:hypothetical protein [Paenarthrobacter sp. A20]MCP1414396.1 hypothetical protein [Paenarthrobacter sp. A20]
MAVEVQHGKDHATTFHNAEKWFTDDHGRLHIVGADGNIASYNQGYWANARKVEMPVGAAANERPTAEPRVIPEGYEPQENSHAKNHAMDALEAALEKQGVEVYTDDYEGGIDLINLADAVVEALIKAGITIPENISNPHGH